jgi:hypothetical protein
MMGPATSSVIHLEGKYAGFSLLVPQEFVAAALRTGANWTLEDRADTDRLMFQAGPAKTPAAPQVEGDYNLSIGYLRAFITLLVLAHHAMLAYCPFAPQPPVSLSAQPRWWQAFPVVDTARSNLFSLLVGFNDVFMMSLMFFLSGLFVWNSLQRKGNARFLRDRFLRLAVPFVFVAAFIAPLAYYPAFLQTGATSGFAGYARVWLSLGNWPTGPAWFVWVLLAFDCIAALLTISLPRWGESLGRLLPAASHPLRFFALLAALSAVAYIPMELAFNPLAWAALGPFTFQTSRILHYLVYFLIGAGVGAYGVSRGVLAPDGKLARRWPLWLLRSWFAFAIVAILAIIASTTKIGSRAWETAGDAAFSLSCAASCLAALAIFVRFARSRVKLFDSLCDNAYGMYLVHYAFVSWLQYSLLPAPLPGIAKGYLVFLGTVALSWGTIALLRRVPVIARVI